MSWGCSRRALTLVEVAAALALLATLLVATLSAFSRQARQIGRCRARLVALESADQRLHAWASSPGGIPVPARGELTTEPQLVWETRLVDKRYGPSLGIDVVQFAVRAAQASDEDLPLVDWELFVPAAKPKGAAPPPLDAGRSP